MLELPEVINIAKQLSENILGKTIESVCPPTKEHKFCWFNGSPYEYEKLIKGASVQAVNGFGIFVEIAFDNGMRLCFNDGVNVRLADFTAPEYQLKISFSDGKMIIFTVAMYGSIILHDGSYDNQYYLKSKSYISPLSQNYDAYFYKVFSDSKKTLSSKAFLATEQRFPGIGNGTLQDILLAAEIHPKRKISTFSEQELDNLVYCIKAVLQDMTEKGGRNTEKNIFGKPGGYETIMSKKTSSKKCPQCGGDIVKENYMGGAIYYCLHCQPLVKDN